MVRIAKVLLLFREHLYLGVYRTNYDLFGALFEDFLSDEKASSNYNLNRSSMSRWCSGQKPVSPIIVRYYARPGYDLSLATTIEDRFVPYMDDFCAMADQIYTLVQLDQDLKPVGKKLLCDGYVHGDAAACAEFVARVLIHAMVQRPDVDSYGTLCAA